MIIGLRSGFVFTCEDESYTATNTVSGETIHTFVSFADKQKFVVRDEDIEFWESRLSDEDIENLATYGDETEKVCIDHSFV